MLTRFDLTLTPPPGPSYRWITRAEAVDAVRSGEVDTVLVDHGYTVEKLAIVRPAVTLDRGLGIGVRQGSALKDTRSWGTIPREGRRGGS